MPPKPSKTRRSQKNTPQFLPIYQILADKDHENAVRQVCKKIEAFCKEENAQIEKSFFVLVLKICGLGNFVEKINWREPINGLTQLLEQITEETQNQLQTGDMYLIAQKSKFHKAFLQRISQFLTATISDELNLTTDTQILKTITNVLLTLSKCKMRNVRHSAVVFSGLFIKRCDQYYGQLVKEKLGKRATKIANLVEQKFIQEIIKPRLKDIDIQIRQKSFQILGETLLAFQHQFITSKKLQKLYTHLFAENKTKVTQICLKSIIKLIDSIKELSSPNTRRELIAFSKDIIKPLQQLMLIPNRNSCHAMDLLLTIHGFNNSLQALKPKMIAKVFQIHGYQKYQQGLKKAVSIFFKSLINFTNQTELIEHRSLLIIQITHLLTSINSTKLLSTILQQFFTTHQNIFNFDDMFLLVFTEYYHRQGSDIELHQNQINIICNMICQFNLYLRKQKINTEIQKQFGSYNKNVLTNSKEIIYEKMGKNRTICHLYLRMFSLLYMPVSSGISNYLFFVQEKILNFVYQEQFITIAGDNWVLMQLIVHECVAICQLIFKDSSKNQLLLKNFRIPQILEKSSLDQIDIIKISQLSSKFNLDQLSLKNTEDLLKKMLSIYPKLNQKVLKLQVLTYCYHTHQHKFISLFNSPSQSKNEEYISLRNGFLNFVIQFILGSGSEDAVIKVAAFNVLARSLKLISNNKISELGPVFYEPTQEQMIVIYDFVNIYVSVQTEEVSEVVSMMASIGLEAQQIREQVISNIFMVFTSCLKIAMNKLSINFISHFMLSNSLLLKQYSKYLEKFLSQLAKLQISPENSNKFVFWRLFSQLTSSISSSQSQSAQQREETQQKLTHIIKKSIQIYYSKQKKSQTQTKSQLNNKLMLFIADSIDKAINNNKYQELILIRNLLNKVKRRFSKQILQRLLIFFTSKIANIEDRQVKNMRDFLNKISKVKKGKNEPKDQQDNYSSSSSEQENKQENQQENQQNDSRKANKDEDIMVERTPIDKDKARRNTRSRTKRKN